MKAAVWSELEVALPADDMWAIYRSPDLPRLIVELMPARFQSIDIIEGDGSEGSVVHIILQPSNSGPQVWNEQFVIIDDATRTKVVRQVKGGYLDIGFNMYENIFQITARGPNACTVRATGSYDVREGFESNASLISASVRMAQVIRDYVIQQKAIKESEPVAAVTVSEEPKEQEVHRGHGHGHGHGHGRGRGRH